MVHPEEGLFAAVSEGGFGDVFAGHYTARGNAIIAERLLMSIVGDSQP